MERGSIHELNTERYGLHDVTNDNGSCFVDLALAHTLVVGGTLYIEISIKEPQVAYMV